MMAVVFRLRIYVIPRAGFNGHDRGLGELGARSQRNPRCSPSPQPGQIVYIFLKPDTLYNLFERVSVPILRDDGSELYNDLVLIFGGFQDKRSELVVHR